MPEWFSAPVSLRSVVAPCITLTILPKPHRFSTMATQMRNRIMSTELRRIAVIGGSRIPFCRANTIHAEKSNMDMLSAALEGLVKRFGLEGQQLDEVVAGAVTTHSRDWDLAREALLSTSLSPLTPGITLQQACGTSLQSALMIGAKIASGQIECGIAAGTDTTSDPPIVFSPRFARRLVKAGTARSLKQRMQAFKGFSLGEL